MQDLTKILPASARQHLLHKPRAHLCGTAQICSTTHKSAKGQCQQRQEGSWTQQEPQAGAQTCSLGAPQPSPGMHRTWAVGRQQQGSRTESNKAFFLFSSCHGPQIWFLLLVTLIWQMPQRNPWLHDSAQWITGFVPGAHLKRVWWKETWQEPRWQSLSNTSLVLPSHAAAWGSVWHRNLLCAHYLGWSVNDGKFTTKDFLVLENQHHIFTSGNNDNVSYSFSGIFFFFLLWLEICQYVGGGMVFSFLTS